MESFKNWLLKLEIGQVMEPDKPEAIPVTAVPTYRPDGADLPPTPRTRRLGVIIGRRMKKK